MSDRLSRREFLGALSLLSLWGLTGCAGRAALKKNRSSNEEILVLPMVGLVGIWNCAKADYSTFEVPNKKPHAIEISPANPHIGVVVDQGGDCATLVNLFEERILAITQPTPGYVFSGHGCFSPDGKHLLLCENPPNVFDKDPPSGRVTVRGVFSGLAVEKIIPSAGPLAHAVAFFNDGVTLAVGYRGTRGEVGQPKKGGKFSFISFSDGRIIGEYVPPISHLSLSHFAVTNDDRILAASQSFYSSSKPDPNGKEVTLDLPCPILLGSRRRKQWEMRFPEELKSRMVRNHSVVIDSFRNRALVAHQFGGLVTSWDLKNFQFLQSLSVDDPQGLAITKDGYWVVTKNKTLLMVDPLSLRINQRVDGALLGPSDLVGPLHMAATRSSA